MVYLKLGLRIKMYQIKTILTITLILGGCLSSFAEDSPKQKINFGRFQKVGDLLKCDIHAKSKATVTRIFTGNKENKMEQYVNSIKLKGKLSIKSVVKSGNADKIEFEVESVEGVVRNKPYIPEWKGKTIVADLNFMPVCKFAIKGDEKPLNKRDIILLSLVFRPVQGENMAAFIGTDKKVGVGDSWDAPKGPLLGLIKKYETLGVKLSPDKISGKVTIKSKKEHKGIDCWEIEEQLSISDVPNFGFGFIVQILLPVDEKISTVKLSRKGIEKVEKIPKGNHPMMAGIDKIIVTLADEMTAEMIPIKNISLEKTQKSQK